MACLSRGIADAKAWAKYRSLLDCHNRQRATNDRARGKYQESKHACMHATRALLAIAFAWPVLSWIEHNLKAVKVGVKFT